MPTIENLGREHLPKPQGLLDVSRFPLGFSGQFRGHGRVNVNIPRKHMLEPANWLTELGSRNQNAYIHSGHDDGRTHPFFGRPANGHVIPEVVVYSDNLFTKVPSTQVDTKPGKYPWSKAINKTITTYTRKRYNFGEAARSLGYATTAYSSDELNDNAATLTYGVAAITSEEERDFYLRGPAAEERQGVSQATTLLVPQMLGREILDQVVENPRSARDIATDAIGSFLVKVFDEDYRAFLLPNYEGIDATIEDNPADCGLVTIGASGNIVHYYAQYPPQH